MTARHDTAGLLVRNARKLAGLTLQDVSLRVGCSIGYISDLERGNRNPTFGTCELLSEILNIDLDELCASWGIIPPDVSRLVTRDGKSIKAVRDLMKG